jgi:hypothetical protein
LNDDKIDRFFGQICKKEESGGLRHQGMYFFHHFKAHLGV